MRALLLLVAVGGCAPAVATSAHVDRVLGPVVVDRTAPVVIKADTVEGVLVVRATLRRVCSRAVFDDYLDQGEGKLFEPAARTKRRVHTATRRRPCPIPAARVPLEITLASGHLLHRTTDRAGAFALVLPDGEDALAVRITAGAMPPPSEAARPVAAAAPPAAQDVPPPIVAGGQGMAGVRDVVLRCGRAFGITGTARLRLKVKDGTATATADHPREDFVRCIATAVASVPFPASTSLEMTISFLVAKP